MRLVDIADLAVSRDSGETLATLALGSCVAVAVWDPVVRAGGLLHFMLPTRIEGLRQAALPAAMFADAGVPLLLERLGALGAKAERLRVGLAGGAQLLGGASVLNIGERNCDAARATLRQAGLVTTAADLGGHESRALRLRISDGCMTVTMRGSDAELPLMTAEAAVAAQ